MTAQVGPRQLPRLHALLLEAAAVVGLARPPVLYVKQSSVVNAFTLAVGGRRPIVVVHSATLDLMDDSELQAVIAHELGHLKCDHGVWLNLANLLALSADVSPIPGASGVRGAD